MDGSGFSASESGIPRRTTASAWVAGLAAMFQTAGLCVDQVFRAAGVERGRLQDGDARFGGDEVTRLWNAALAAAGNPALGIDRGMAARHVNFDLVGFAMLASPTLGAAIDSLARYLDLISSATTLQIEHEGELVWVTMDYIGCTLPVPWQRQAFSMLAFVTLGEWATRAALVPRRVEFRFARPDDGGALAGAFGCTPAFARPRNRLALTPAQLAQPLPSGDAGVYGLHECALRSRLTSLHDTRLAHRVSREVLKRLPQGEPRRSAIAASLALSDRTLQRRLQEENTSFQELVDQLRRDLARQYLAQQDTPLGEVAFLLGFGSESTFFRASRRWFGVTPGQLRGELVHA